MIRVAAVGDVHVGVDNGERLRQRLSGVGDHADVLLIAGDLTRHGRLEEIDALLHGLAGLTVPVVVVLGNHDHHADAAGEVRRRLESGGVTVLEGEATVVEVGGHRLGIAGTVGFGGGFPGGTVADFGEPLMKEFAARGRELADGLRGALESLDDVDAKIALAHYAPVRETVEGENPEIFPFLGSHWLADAADRGGADLFLHGHAHHGSERGETPGGVPVRNVAEPVIAAPYRILELPVRERTAP